jgi:hypothetical protein
VHRLAALIDHLPFDAAVVTAELGWPPQLEFAAAAVEGLDRVVVSLGGHKGRPLQIPRPPAPDASPRPRAETPDEVIAAVTAAFGPRT